MLSDPAFVAAAVAALLIAGVAKGGFGSAAAFASTPILALAAPAPVAIAILLPILTLIDHVSLWAYRWKWDWPNARALLLSALIGIGAGALLFEHISEAAMKILLGATALGFVGWRTFGPRKPPSKPGRFSGVIYGALAGFTSMVAHAGGPMVAMHLLPQKLPKTVYQGTVVFFFWGVNLVKFAPYLALGLITAETLWVSLALAPLAALGAMIGVWAHHRASDDLYYKIAYTGLVLIGGKLIYDGIAAL